MLVVSKDTFLKLAHVKYISLDDPDFHFLKDASLRELYQRVFVQLSLHFAVSDETEPNYDVCLAFYIKGGEGKWSLELSLLGLYAELTRLDAETGIGIGAPPLTRETATTQEENLIIDIIESHGITLLDQDTLETPVELTLTNAEPGHVYLYQALFTDKPLLPWRSKLNNWWPLQDEVYDKLRG